MTQFPTSSPFYQEPDPERAYKAPEVTNQASGVDFEYVRQTLDELDQSLEGQPELQQIVHRLMGELDA